jgi:hypothetical protein
MSSTIAWFLKDPVVPPSLRAEVMKILDNPSDSKYATKMAEELLLRSKERIDRWKFLADRIDKKGQAILSSGEPWKGGILTFSYPFESLSDEEQGFIDQQTNEWKVRIVNK